MKADDAKFLLDLRRDLAIWRTWTVHYNAYTVRRLLDILDEHVSSGMDTKLIEFQNYAVERIVHHPSHTHPMPIPWPSGLRPVPQGHVPGLTPLPTADVLVVTWTAAESEALADIFTPGLVRSLWTPYRHNWQSFAGHLTDRSPARYSQALGHWALTRIKKLDVVCFKSELHLATDDATAPIIALWKQIVNEVQPRLIITTGTAGGIGSMTQLGDVFLVTNAKFNCTKTFKDQPWAQKRFHGPQIKTGSYLQLVNRSLIEPNSATYEHMNTHPVRAAYVTNGDVETVDYFAFADTADSYGVKANDPVAVVEEMDDATLPLALSEMDLLTPWVSIRNASDPEVPSSIGTLEAQKQWAARIYQRYGYWTTIGSALASWAVILDNLA